MCPSARSRSRISPINRISRRSRSSSSRTTDPPRSSSSFSVNQPSKKEVMQALLDDSEARVHLDARRDGVKLPPRLLKDGHVCLDYGYALKPPIHDLEVS